MTTTVDLPVPSRPPAAPVRTARSVPAAYPAARPAGDDLLLLDRNEGPAAALAAPWVRAALAAARSDRYPDPAPLERALAARFGVDPACVLATAGGDDAIDRCGRLALGPGDALVAPVPTFDMFPRTAQAAGAAVRGVPWPRGPLPVEALRAAIDARTAMVALVSPNNPTGLAATRDEIDAVCAAAPGRLVVVDLAYAEFADDDPLDAVLAHPNAVAIRTLSKAYGLAGLRCGCAIGDPRTIALLRGLGSPFPIAAPSLAVAVAATVAAPDWIAPYVARVRHERAALAERCVALGLEAMPGQANFVLVRGADGAALRARLAAQGVLVRAFPDDPGLADAVRITCPGDAGAFARLRSALDRALGGAA